MHRATHAGLMIAASWRAASVCWNPAACLGPAVVLGACVKPVAKWAASGQRLAPALSALQGVGARAKLLTPEASSNRMPRGVDSPQSSDDGNGSDVRHG